MAHNRVVSSLYPYVGPGAQTQVGRVGGKHSYHELSLCWPQLGIFREPRLYAVSSRPA